MLRTVVALVRHSRGARKTATLPVRSCIFTKRVLTDRERTVARQFHKMIAKAQREKERQLMDAIKAAAERKRELLRSSGLAAQVYSKNLVLAQQELQRIQQEKVSESSTAEERAAAAAAAAKEAEAERLAQQSAQKAAQQANRQNELHAERVFFKTLQQLQQRRKRAIAAEQSKVVADTKLTRRQKDFPKSPTAALGEAKGEESIKGTTEETSALAEGAATAEPQPRQETQRRRRKAPSAAQCTRDKLDEGATAAPGEVDTATHEAARTEETTAGAAAVSQTTRTPRRQAPAPVVVRGTARKGGATVEEQGWERPRALAAVAVEAVTAEEMTRTKTTSSAAAGRRRVGAARPSSEAASEVQQARGELMALLQQERTRRLASATTAPPSPSATAPRQGRSAPRTRPPTEARSSWPGSTSSATGLFRL